MPLFADVCSPEILWPIINVPRKNSIFWIQENFYFENGGLACSVMSGNLEACSMMLQFIENLRERKDIFGPPKH